MYGEFLFISRKAWPVRKALSMGFLNHPRKASWLLMPRGDEGRPAIIRFWSNFVAYFSLQQCLASFCLYGANRGCSGKPFPWAFRIIHAMQCSSWCRGVIEGDLQSFAFGLILLINDSVQLTNLPSSALVWKTMHHNYLHHHSLSLFPWCSLL